VAGSKVERNVIISHPEGGAIYAEREKMNSNDPAAGDYGFREGSPAIDLGIEPLNVSKAGIQK
jgi:hypothetical protein